MALVSLRFVSICFALLAVLASCTMVLAQSQHGNGRGPTLKAVGGPDTLTMDEIIRVALRVLGRRRPILHAPDVLMKALTAPLTLLPSPPMTPAAIDFIVQSAPVDTGPLTAALPRSLTPLPQALATYLGPRR